jgi:hypothetical protein
MSGKHGRRLISPAGAIGLVFAHLVGRKRVNPRRVLARQSVLNLKLPSAVVELGLHPDLARTPLVVDEHLDVRALVGPRDVMGGHGGSVKDGADTPSDRTTTTAPGTTDAVAVVCRVNQDLVKPRRVIWASKDTIGLHYVIAELSKRLHCGAWSIPHDRAELMPSSLFSAVREDLATTW